MKSSTLMVLWALMANKLAISWKLMAIWRRSWSVWSLTARKLLTWRFLLLLKMTYFFFPSHSSYHPACSSYLLSSVAVLFLIADVFKLSKVFSALHGISQMCSLPETVSNVGLLFCICIYIGRILNWCEIMYSWREFYAHKEVLIFQMKLIYTW